MTQNEMPLSIKIGKKLKKLIKLSKYKTQERFSEAMNVEAVTVRRWLAYGIRDVDTIKEICDKLGVDFMELLK